MTDAIHHFSRDDLANELQAAATEAAHTAKATGYATGVSAVGQAFSMCMAAARHVAARATGNHKQLFEAMDELRRRVAELEARPALVYEGIWSADDEYKSGEAVTFGGSLWICREATTTSKPGTGDHWQLAVKKGRDGRDGRNAA